MSKFRKKPVIIEAFQLPDSNNRDEVDELHIWATAVGFDNWEGEDDGIVIYTPAGNMYASPGDWIIKGIKGKFYPCKPDIFEATYERVP